MNNFNGPAPRDSQDRRTVLARILDTPHLERVVPRLQPELLHRVIQSCGLEDCGELVALATPGQLCANFRSRPVASGAAQAWTSNSTPIASASGSKCCGIRTPRWRRRKLAGMDADLVIAGLAQHARVFDCAVVTPYRTTDGLELPGIPGLDHEPGFEVGGYRLVAKRADSWEAIVSILLSLDAEYPDYFHQVMRGCRALSNAGRELDELDDLLPDGASDHVRPGGRSGTTS